MSAKKIEDVQPPHGIDIPGTVAGTASMKAFGAAGFTGQMGTPPPPVEELFPISEKKVEAKRRFPRIDLSSLPSDAVVDLFALVTMAVGVVFLFAGVWVWFGIGPALTTLGAVVVIIGFWTSVDNHRAKTTPQTVLTNGK